MSDLTAMSETVTSSKWSNVVRDETKPIAERLTATVCGYQALRDERGLPADIAFAGIARAIEWLAEEHCTAQQGELADISKDIRAVEEAHGLKPDEYWERGAGPEEWKELPADFDAELDQVTASLMTEFGEGEMAELFRHDRAEFDYQSKAGQQEARG